MSTNEQQAQEPLPEPQFSYFESCLNPRPIGVITVSQFLHDIRTGRFKQEIETIRSIPDKDKRNEVKKLLRAATISGEFGPTRGNNNQTRHSGLIAIDLDNLKNVPAFIEKLKLDKHTYALFISPSGNGIKIFVRIPADAKAHKSVFRALRRYYKKKFLLIADEKCGDISRLCYVSYDPDAFVNPDALVFTVEPAGLPAELRDSNVKVEDYPVDMLYRVSKNEYGNVKYITIRHARFLHLLQVLGFRRFDLGTGFLLVSVKDNIIEEAAKTTIQDAFFSFIKGLPDELPEGVSNEVLYEKFVKTPENYFSDTKLSILEKVEPNFCKDSAEEVRFFYRNGFVKCTKTGYTLHPYSEMDGLIWKSQILTRDFEVAIADYSEPEGLPDFAKFIWNVSGKEQERFTSFLTLIGYLLHDNFEGKTRAIIMTDSDVTPYANGRTGKTLFAKALGQITPLCEINGKDLNPDDRFKYMQVNLPDRIVHINDIKKNLSIEKFFVDITEGLSVQKKNKQPFRKQVRIIISTNRTMKIEGASARDRVIEIEFSSHYSETFSPQDEFGKWFFGKGWTDHDWLAFDNFICACVCLYLRDGVHTPSQINLGRRKLLASTNEDFLDFIDAQVKDGRIRAGIVICKNDLRDEFLKEYPEYRDALKDVSKATAWLRAYANLSGHFAPNNAKQDEKAGNGKKYFVFRAVGYKRPALTQFVQPQVEEVATELV